MTRTVFFLFAAVLGALAPNVFGSEPHASPATHWAFLPVRDPAPPVVRRADWCRTDLDRFLLADWELRGVQPTADADRTTLLRRVTFDLTGLPPTLAETDAFLADATPAAWGRVVDRLLASPRYGEHWGRHWLDVVRYADTAGETADYPVPVAWRYRNYVIDAFNADKPYDEFLREQIAGDILAKGGLPEHPDRFAERVVATGYLAISRRFGFDSENYHHLTIQDTVDNLGQAVLGLTLGCARCHAHKYDPVSMPDYYALYGIFESTRYPFPGSEQKQRLRALAPLVPPEESQPRWRIFEARVAALTHELDAAKQKPPAAVLRSLDDLDGDFEMQAPAAGGSKGVLVPPWVYEGPIAVTTDAQSPFKNHHALGRVGASIPAGASGYSISQALYPRRSRDRHGRFHFNLDFRLPSASNQPPASAKHRVRLGSDTRPLLDLVVAHDHIQVRAGGRSHPIRTLEPGAWHNVQLDVDLTAGTVTGRIGKPGDIVEFPPLALDDTPAPAPEIDRVELASEDLDQGTLPAVFFDNLGIQTASIPPVSTNALVVEIATRTASEAESAAPAGRPDDAERVARVRKELETLLAAGPFDMAYAVSEGTPRNTRIHTRGEPERPGEKVPRGTLPILGGGPLSEGVSGSGRLELADWLTDPKNPLTARVMVNRVWQYHFGEGLVRTPNDFGTRGQPPTNPDLLDYLATRFVRSGWSVKALHRLILSSSAYLQRGRYSETSDGILAAVGDPNCPVFPPSGASVESVASVPSPGTASGAVEAAVSDAIAPFTPFPRRRLSAEEIRDSILFTSGGLDPGSGTEHPFPAPTGWGYTQHGPYAGVYDHSRRSVYLMTQRLKRHPFLALFDGPDPNASTPERRISTVPTQALYFLNDPFVHAQARLLAARVLGGDDDSNRIVNALYRRVYGRNPDRSERIEALDFLEAYRSELEESKATDATTAATAALARVLFGSNEFLTVD